MSKWISKVELNYQNEIRRIYFEKQNLYNS